MPSTAAVLAIVLAVATLGAPAAAPAGGAQDDPRKCFVVTGPDGQPLNTICVPWPVSLDI